MPSSVCRSLKAKIGQAASDYAGNPACPYWDGNCAIDDNGQADAGKLQQGYYAKDQSRKQRVIF
jgi:hypothetical protein